LETAATIRDLLNEREQVLRYADVRAFTSQAPSRLEVLASDRDPGVSVAFGADDYCDAARLLEHFYEECLDELRQQTPKTRLEADKDFWEAKRAAGGAGRAGVSRLSRPGPGAAHRSGCTPRGVLRPS